MKKALALLMTVALVALMGACAAEPTATPVPPTPVPPTATSEAMMMMMMEAADVLLIALNEQSSSGQMGWAMLTAKGAQTEVTLSLSAGAMESELVHIHTGPCGPTLGAVTHDLTSFAGGTSTTTVNASLASLLTGGFAINAHQKGNAGAYTACGNLPAKAGTLTIALDEQSKSGQHGFATLTARGTKTEVVLSLSPGAMESELVHIHTGPCGPTLGRVDYDLTTITGGASSTTVAATLASLRTGGFAINAHQKGNAGVYTACGVIPAAPAASQAPAAPQANVSSTPVADTSGY